LESNFNQSGKSKKRPERKNEKAKAGQREINQDRETEKERRTASHDLLHINTHWDQIINPIKAK